MEHALLVNQVILEMILIIITVSHVQEEQKIKQKEQSPTTNALPVELDTTLRSTPPIAVNAQ